MPFDDFGRPTTTRRPTPADLAHALRHLPHGWKWSYPDPFRCGMGLARYLWPKAMSEFTDCAILEVFGFDYDTAAAIFGNAHVVLELGDRSQVTPEHIAGLIDRWVAGDTAWYPRASE